MGFDLIAQRAKELIECDTLLMRFQRDVKKDEAADQDVERAADDDEQLGRFAQHVCDTLEAPPARYQVILERLKVIRQMSRERFELAPLSRNVRRSF
jgi:hypothetical protein